MISPLFLRRFACLILVSLFPTVLLAETNTFIPEYEFVHPVLFESRYGHQESAFVHSNPAKLRTASRAQISLDTAQNFFSYDQYRVGYVLPFRSFVFGFGYGTFRVGHLPLTTAVEDDKPTVDGRAAHSLSVYRFTMAFSLRESTYLGVAVSSLYQRLVGVEAFGSKADISFLKDFNDDFWGSILIENAAATPMQWPGAIDPLKTRMVLELGGRYKRLESSVKTDFSFYRLYGNLSLHEYVSITGDWMLGDSNLKRLSYGVLLNFGEIGVQYLHLQTLTHDLGVHQDSVGFLYRF